MTQDLSKSQQENNVLRRSINERASNYNNFGHAPVSPDLYHENLHLNNGLSLNSHREVNERIKRVEKNFEEIVRKQKENGEKRKEEKNKLKRI